MRCVRDGIEFRLGQAHRQMRKTRRHFATGRTDKRLMSIHPTADLGTSWTPFSCFEAPTHDPLSPLSVSNYAANALVMLAMDVAIWPYALARPHFLRKVHHLIIPLE
jgi:hypothetical protein